jgi:hypothetical protein
MGADETQIFAITTKSLLCEFVWQCSPKYQHVFEIDRLEPKTK